MNEKPEIQKSQQYETEQESSNGILTGQTQEEAEVRSGADKQNGRKNTAFISDSTRKEDVEALIKNKEERYRTLFEQNLAGLYQSTVTGIIVNCNDAFARMLRYNSARELFGTNVFNLYYATIDRNKFIAELQEKKKLSNYEAILKRKDGTALHTIENISLRTDVITGEQFYDGMLVDVTDSAVTQRELGWLINNTEESFILLNTALEIVSYNRQFQELYSKYLGVRVMKGRSIMDYALPERREALKIIYERVLAGSQEASKIIITSPDYPPLHIALTYKPAKDEFSEIIGVFVSIIDETEKIKSEQQRQFEIRDREALINTTTDLMWSLTREYKLIAANQAFLNNFKDATNVTLQPGDDLMHEGSFSSDFLLTWKKLYQRAFEGESFIEEIQRPAWGDNEEVWAETRFNPIYDRNQITGVACYTRDTTASRTNKSRLLKLNQKLETAQQIAHLGYWESDMGSDALYWTDEVYRIWGVSPDTPINFHFFYDSIHPDDKNTFDVTQKDAILNNRKFDCEHRIILHDGSVKCVHELGDLIYSPAGEVIRMEGSVQDITERKKAEAELEDLTNRLVLATNSAGLGIWEWNIQADSIKWDERMCRLYDREKEADCMTTYSSWMSTIHPADVERIQAEINAAISGDEEFISEFRIYWRDNSIHYLRTTAVIEFNQAGIPLRMIGTCCDITKHKLVEKRNQFRADLLNTIGQAVVSTDIDGTINYWNNAAKNIYGWFEEEAVGSKLTHIIPSDHSEGQSKQIISALETGKSVSGEFTVRHKNGSMFPVFVTEAPVFDEKNKLTGVIGVSTDITERKLVDAKLKELNRNLLQQAKELALSNAELEQFAYVASHDLQEPLRMVTSFLQLIEKKYGALLDDKGHTYIAFAVDGAKRMRQIILDLLDFSRIGATDDKFEPIDLNVMLDDLRRVFKKDVTAGRIFIHSDNLPVISSYPTPLRQVFQNLISNGLKYRKHDVEPQIHVKVKAIKDFWQFEISDNGIGIEAEYYDKIFVIFQRLHNSSAYSGTGMGLAIAKKIIDNLGGQIWVRSIEGEGSTFYFTIPKEK